MDVEKIKVNIKRFFSNPNTLTFLLVLVLIVIIYLGYSYLIKTATKPATLPYALKKINAKTEITPDVVGSVKISGTFVAASGSGLIKNAGQVYNKYVAEGYQVPEKSFFYEEMLADEKIAEETAVSKAPDGFTLFALNVNFHSTYGCSIMPGNYIDIYLKASENGQIMFEKFIESIKVTKVVDSKGEDVFTKVDDESNKMPNPSKLYFIVPTSYYELLSKALLISASDLELVVVPRNSGYSEKPKETAIASENAEYFILSKAYTLSTD